MPIDPDEWLITAQRLVTAAQPSEADLRRGVSSAYYAVFHTLLKTATQRLLGPRLDSGYQTLYRAFDHRKMKRLCDQLASPKVKEPYVRALGFEKPSDEIREFARGFSELQQRRHEADYNPLMTQYQVDSLSLVQLAEDTVQAFGRIQQQQQNAILLYMLVEAPTRNS